MLENARRDSKLKSLSINPLDIGVRTVEGPLTTVAMDIIGPQPRSKNGAVYVLVLQDIFTKLVDIVPLRKATGKKVKKAFQHFVQISR